MRQITKIILSIIILMAIINTIAFYFHLYYELWWIDIVMHFGGGFWVALMFIWFVYFSGLFNLKNKIKLSHLFTLTLIWSLLIGIVWELFEYKIGITYISPSYMNDTISDIIFDLLGAFMAIIYMKKKVSVTLPPNSDNVIV